MLHNFTQFYSILLNFTQFYSLLLNFRGGHAYVWKGHSILLGDYIEKNIYGDAIPYKPNIKDVRSEA